MNSKVVCFENISVPNNGFAKVTNVCVNASCISKIKVDYYGPIEKQTFLDALGGSIGIKQATWFDEEVI